MLQFKYGDLIIMELALVQMVKDMDISMQCGLAVSEAIGKIEFQLAALRAAIAKQVVPPLVPPTPEPPKAGK